MYPGVPAGGRQVSGLDESPNTEKGQPCSWLRRTGITAYQGNRLNSRRDKTGRKVVGARERPPAGALRPAPEDTRRPPTTPATRSSWSARPSGTPPLMQFMTFVMNEQWEISLPSARAVAHDKYLSKALCCMDTPGIPGGGRQPTGPT
ncbi:hypothetical protein SSP35_02_05360 [Streptomyces sp. NBRC 110611]|nr:hypothetical protein SSP35_02_05360 [Streptomyces sp. NBRC 110611]